MSPSSRSASSRPSLSSTRSTPPTDDGHASKMASPKKAHFPLHPPEDSSPADAEEESPGVPPEDIALPSETSIDTLLETTSKDDTEIDAIFEQTDPEDEGSPRRPPSIPDYSFTGPRDYSRLSDRDSDYEDDRAGTPPPNPFGPTIRSATMKTAGRVAGDNGMILPSAVTESPSPYISRSRMSSAMTNRGGAKNSMFDVPIFSPFSSHKKKKSRSGFAKSNPSPTRRGGRMLDVPIAPSPDPSPLVLLHVTLLPLPAQGPASSVLANHLRKMISPTVVARGLLLPHPNDDYDALIEMVAENLGLDQETPPPFKKTATYAFDDCASHSEGSYLGSSDDEGEAYCPSCSRRRLKPEFARHDRPRKHRRPFTHNEKWYTINVFASNGLMRSGAWSRSWEEMERIDVEVTVTPGYEDIEPPKSLRPSSQRSDGKRSLQGSFQFKRRVQPIAGVETTSDEDIPRPRKVSAGRRRPSGPRVMSGSIRSRNSSSQVKQEPLSELEIPVPSADTSKDIYSEDLDTDVPIFEATDQEEGEFVPIWEDKDTKEGEESKSAERLRSEEAWTTDEEPSKAQAKEEDAKSPSPEDEDPLPEMKEEDQEEDDRRLSAFTLDTAIHHTIVGSSRETSVESEAVTISSPEPEETPAASPPQVQRRSSNPHRLHPSSRRASREISPAELNGYAASEKTASRPTSSRNPDNMAIVGLAISDESDEVLEDIEEDKENHHDSVDNKENIPCDVSDEEPEPRSPSSAADVSREYPSDEEPEALKPIPTPQRKSRAVTPKTAGPSPMPSRFSSPAISPDISPMASRSGSPQPQSAKEGKSRERRRRSTRHSFDRSFESTASPASPRSRAGSRRNSFTRSASTPSPRRESPRGRSFSRTSKRSPSLSATPLEKEDPIPDSVLERLRFMIKPTIDTISTIPLPTLLLIAIPFAGLIAFSVNSYVQQRNLDFMVRSFMESQVAREMQMLHQQQQVVPLPKPGANGVPQYAPAPPSVVEQVVAEAEKALPHMEPMLSPEEKAELEWNEAQKKGLDHESVVYGIQVGGKCVMPQDVPDAIRKAAYEREEFPSNHGGQLQQPADIEVPEGEVEDDTLIDFTQVKPVEEEELPGSPKFSEEERRGREEQRFQEDEYPKYDRTGSRSPMMAPYRPARDRSRERKDIPQQPLDYFHGPAPYHDEFDRVSEAGDIDVGKVDVRDGGLDEWFKLDDIPEMMLPPPVREIPASPSKVQQPAPESVEHVGSDGNTIVPAAETSTLPKVEDPEPSQAAEKTEEPQKPEEQVTLPEPIKEDAVAEEVQGVQEDAASRPATPVSATPEQKPSRPASRRGSPRAKPQEPASRPASRDGKVVEEAPELPATPVIAPTENVEDISSASRPATRDGATSPILEEAEDDDEIILVEDSVVRTGYTPQQRPADYRYRTGYTPQQRPADYKSRPSSRSGHGQDSEAGSRPSTRNGEVPSRPPTRNGRANSRPPPSRSASKSRPGSRGASGSRSRSRPRSSGGPRSPTASFFSSSTMTPVQETETIQEQASEETQALSYGPLNLQIAKEMPTAVPEVPVEPVTEAQADTQTVAEPEPEAVVADPQASFFEKLKARFGQQVMMAEKAAAASESAVPAQDTPASPSMDAVVETEVESAVPIAATPLVASPVFAPSEPSSEYDQYEDAEEYYDEYDPEYLQQQAAEQYYDDDGEYYDDYATEGTDYQHVIPEGLMQEDYVFEDEDGGYTEAEEFDYEGFKGSVKEGWWEGENKE